jgi:hypothetical protein
MEGKKTGGRSKGVPNKVTQVTRQLINNLATEMLPDVMANLKLLEPMDQIRVWIKLCEFIVAKPQSVSIGLETDVKKTIEDKLRELAGEE